MQNLPHRYSVAATADSDTNVLIGSPGLVQLESAAPAEFGGPGDRWSPETLLVAAVADCFVLTFKAIARASKFEWISLSCEVDGILDRVDRVTRFTEFNVNVVLNASQDSDEQKALLLLQKTETSCLISNSLTANIHFYAKYQTPPSTVAHSG